MNIWAKMMSALRGGVNDAGEAIVDSQALKILDQEVRDISEELKQSKGCLAEIIAHQKVSQQKCDSLKSHIEEHESYAIKALEKDHESLAYEVAQKIADLEGELDQEKKTGSEYEIGVNNLRTVIKQTERDLKRIKQQMDTVKATENVQRAQSAVAQRDGGPLSKMGTAMDSLDRIKKKQALKAAQISATSELAEDDPDASLQVKLEKAGIVNGRKSVDDIVARLRNKK